MISPSLTSLRERDPNVHSLSREISLATLRNEEQEEDSFTEISALSDDDSFSECEEENLVSLDNGKIVASRGVRRLFLFLLSFVTLGNSWSYVDPSSLNVSLQATYGSSDYDFVSQLNMLYSFFSIPNILLPILIGFYLSKHPKMMGNAMLFSNLLIVIGAGVFAMSLSLPVTSGFIVSLLGRVLNGVGTETLTIVQSYYIYAWFADNRELNFAFAVTSSAMQLAPAINYNVTPIIVQSLGIIPDVWFSTIICFICLLFGQAIVMIDSRYQPTTTLLVKSTSKLSGSSASIMEEAVTEISPEEKDQDCCGPEQRESISSKQAGPDDIYDTFGINSLIYCFRYEIPTTCYILIFSFITYCGATSAFIGIHPYYLMSKARYNYDISYTNFICSLQDIVQAIMNPFIGALIDYAQHESWFYTSGMFGIFCWFLVQVVPPLITGWPGQIVMLSETNTFLPNPLILAIFAGVIGVLSGNTGWSLISSLTPEKHQTTIFGLVGALLNLSSAIMPLILTALTDTQLTFETVMIVLSAITACSFLSGVLLVYRLGGKVNIETGHLEEEDVLDGSSIIVVVVQQQKKRLPVNQS